MRPVHPAATIVALGDSTTAGTPGFRSPIETPPHGAGDVESQYAHWLMRSRPEWRVLNRGVNGERADQILARFARDVLDAAPDAVVIIAGVNDLFQGREPSVVTRALDTMYRLARGAGIAVVAGTIVPFNTANDDQNARMRAVNEWIDGQARSDVAIVFCDTRSAVAAPGAPDRLATSPDGLHPDPDGYRRMAAVIEPAIARALTHAGRRGGASALPGRTLR